jgi:hypothetical protein
MAGTAFGFCEWPGWVDMSYALAAGNVYILLFMSFVPTQGRPGEICPG